ncbi:component of SufBCD complex [Jannaschia sp. S6380]|uniref:component of SufBCD complex n=1 Tax=Jannaschia sp. S6380 TaxID=2926408 RepID=UPI001FF6D6BA|nr:component of SufBCD complex [Jannaschia sp. S6380]MCK0169271.1 component of SufBCD complex [Jannaschia sp. S6380]
MDFFFLQLAFEAIDMRSFSNLWFWIALAVMWSTAAHWVVGVPFDMVRRAAKGHEQSMSDMQVLASIQARRLLFIADATGLLSTAFSFFAITALSLLGFLYGVEFAQAILLLFLPMTLVAWVTLRAARRVDGSSAEELGNLLFRTRRVIQGIGIVSIFVTSMWGMWVNLNANVLGG